MNWRINIIVFLLFILACKENEASNLSKIKTKYVIEANELMASVHRPNIKIIDFRKRENYENEHIVGALNIWRTDIENTSYPYTGMMASKTQIETLFGKLGIQTKDTLIVYDDNGLCEASRLWWILQNYDFENVKLLNGGISGWKSINGEVSTKTPKVNATRFKLTKTPKMRYYASKEQVINAIKNNTVILDTRSEDEYSGKKQKKGASKGGRIPKSIHMDWVVAIHYNGEKRFKSIKDLEKIYGNLNKNDSIILYCHSGVRSAHTNFVLTQLLGYKNVKNYDGSWTEWSYFSDLPFENDSIN
ncbi:thiosulfate/3-mercaptopyruvate sulfurtransferase [Hyunsoonleella jejuensis]|uniref:Sulfurtransferase n=1 Tax=Hyunsoonleella jejuensis TaxID=419940 RepID=A0A1H9BEM4_9FLAO|nr:sulfurtransferase [Hyunsoonleella jejuensis]SEP87452.1 thiosulfate/3-mercaptopyruvate sulfurtransferase [Hyunsoonleella jejuensis]